MGISLFSRCSSSAPDVPASVAVSPDPAYFKILELKQFGDNVVAKIHYPNCTNFEGIKICLYRGVTCDELRAEYILDPHFERAVISPFARFRPDKAGWTAACVMAELLTNYKEK